MKLIWPPPLLGQDKREFAASVVIVPLWLLNPLSPAFYAPETHTPLDVAFQREATTLVGLFVVCLVAFFCALNAYNDQQQHPMRRRVALVWVLRLLERQVQAIEAAIRHAFAQDAQLQSQLELLMSVPGFGFISAVTVLAETSGFATLEDGHQISAYSGLAPAPHQSGLSRGKGSISKVGNARLRRIAYLAALGASRSSSPLGLFYKALRERGKPPRVALVALARKLLRVGIAVVKSGQPYHASYLRAVPQTAA